MKEENTAPIGDGVYVSCLCGKHKENSKCEVYLRNKQSTWEERFKEFYWEKGRYEGRPLGIDGYLEFIREERQRAKEEVLERIENAAVEYEMREDIDEAESIMKEVSKIRGELVGRDK